MSVCALVTGGCGYIGSHVTRRLSEAGYRVVVVDNLSTGFRESLLHNEELIVLDLADKERLDAVFRTHQFGVVLHLAASIVVPDSTARPLEYYRNNTANTLNLLELVVEHHVPHIVFSSTASIYGECQQRPLHETDEPAPTNPYARSKLMDEWMLADLSRATSLRHVILRYFNVAGAEPQSRIGQRFPNSTHLIKVAAEHVIGARDGITIFGTDYDTEDGTGVRDYVHVEDLAAAHVAAVKYLEGGGASALLNCGYGRGFSVRQVLEAMQRVSDKPLNIKIGPRRAGDVSSLIADTALIHKTLDWQPQHDSLDEIAASAVAWEKRLAALRV